MPTPPPSYIAAISPAGSTSTQEGSRSYISPGAAQASVISGVGMAALYCAKMAYDYYCPPEQKKGEKKEEKKWLGKRD
jgi:hypothetical protein